MTYEFKVGDKGKTRTFLDYEVIAISYRLSKPVVAIVNDAYGYRVHSFDAHGYFLASENISDMDLLPPKRKLTFYVNVYERKIDSHIFRHVAEECATPDALLVAQKAEFEV